MNLYKNPCKVITGKRTRWAYANVWEPKTPLHGGKPKFSVRLIIPKDDYETVAKCRAAISAALEEGKEKLRNADGTLPHMSELKIAFVDGDTAVMNDPDTYRGCYYINANSDRAPGIVDKDKVPIILHSEVYSGVYGRASIQFYAFNVKGVKGVACGLLNLQKIRDGEHLGKPMNAADDFKEV